MNVGRLSEDRRVEQLVAQAGGLELKIIRLTCRKPFNWLAEGLSQLKCLPLLDEIHNWLLSSEINLPPIEPAVYQREVRVL